VDRDSQKLNGATFSADRSSGERPPDESTALYKDRWPVALVWVPPHRGDVLDGSSPALFEADLQHSRHRTLAGYQSSRRVPCDGLGETLRLVPRSSHLYDICHQPEVASGLRAQALVAPGERHPHGGREGGMHNHAEGAAADRLT
jgi:hypothetical protein